MTTRIDTLELKNFRLFRELSITFHPELTVLVAPNGGGKTAILDALAISLYPLVYAIRNKNESHPIEAEDNRLGRDPHAPGSMVKFTPTIVRAQGIIDDKPTEWSLERAKDAKKAYYVNAHDAVLRGEALLKDLQGYADGLSPSPPVLPTIAYYGTGRLWRKERRTGRKKQVAEDLRFRVGAYEACLSSSSSYEFVKLWFERVVLEALKEQHSGRVSPHQPQIMMDAMRLAIDTVLEPSGWHRLDWDPMAEEMVAEHSDRGRLSVDLLSDGVRNLIALVADLAHRAIRLNPQLGIDACKLAPGIVLIDEVDMHLHPEWQQLVIGQLRKAFPRIQFIVTTHSPQVLSTVDKESIRILRTSDGMAAVETPKFQTRGVESADVLAFIMGVHPVPQVEEARLLSEYRARIEQYQADIPEALEMRQKLIAHFGSQHPIMIDCDRLIRFQNVKRSRLAAKQEG